MRRGLAPLLLFALLLSGCAGSVLANCQTRQCLREAALQNPIRSTDFWQASLARPMNERIAVIPDELLEYLVIDNRLYGLPDNLEKLDDPRYREMLWKVYDTLPAEVKSLVESRLVGIFAIRNLGTSGFLEAVSDAAGNPVAAVIVIDASLFTRSANDWASWKNSTPFKQDSDYRIRTTIASEEDNTILAALQFILLHELGHAVSIGRDVHPRWTADIETEDIGRYPFSGLSWKIDYTDKRFRSRFDQNFRLRESIRFYQEPLLEARQMRPVLEQLSGTNFVSLYGATSPFEDFAESFAIYVHSELMGRPFKTEVMQQGAVTAAFESCLPDHCRQKYEILKRVFAQ